MLNLKNLTLNKKEQNEVKYKSMTQRKIISLDSKFFKIKTFRQWAENEIADSRTNDKREIHEKLFLRPSNGNEVCKTHRPRLEHNSESNELNQAENKKSNSLIKHSRKNFSYDVRQDRKTILEEKRIKILVEKIRERTRDLNIKSLSPTPSYLVTEKIHPKYMDQFKQSFKMQSMDIKKQDREFKLQKVKDNYLQFSKQKISNNVITTNRKLYGDLFKKIKNRLMDKQTARNLVVIKLIKSMLFMKFLYGLRKQFTLSIVKNSVIKMKDMQRKKLVLMMKDKCLRNRLVRTNKNQDLIRCLLSMKYSITSSSDFKFRVQKELFHKIYFLNRFVEKAAEYQKAFLFVKQRFRNSMVRKRFWVLFLSSRLQSLKLAISKKISNEMFVDKIFLKVLDCLYIADIHSQALESVRNYSMNSIVLKTPKNNFERFHNKMISLIFYYFPPSDPGCNFKISRLFNFKDFTTFMKTTESLMINIYLGF